MEMGFPLWLRIAVALSTVMQLVFGVMLFVDPGRIGDLWPWTMPPLTARVLGASTLVSIPMAFLAVGINRYALAAIPFVMMATYRVLQLAAGAIHSDRFVDSTLTAANYFGGGLLMLAVFVYGLWAGQNGRLPSAASHSALAKPLPWTVGTPFRLILAAVGIGYVVLGVLFFVNAAHAAPWWVDARGMTPLTARLFSSPLIGLGLGLLLVSRASDWRAVVIPATGMLTIGLVVTFAFVLGRADFAATSLMAWLVAATPLLLFAIGVVLLASGPPLTALRRSVA
jgi:hypothetical protein